MKLSTRTRYGARLLLDLARHQDRGPVQIGDISKRQDISVKYLEQIIRPLKKTGLIISSRGPKGGHVLSKAPEEISLSQIVSMMEKEVAFVKCVEKRESCRRSDSCSVRLAWQEACAAFYEKLDSITIADLLEVEDQLGKEKTCHSLETKNG